MAHGGWLQEPTGTATIPGSCADSSATLLSVSHVILTCASHYLQSSVNIKCCTEKSNVQRKCGEGLRQSITPMMS